MSCTTKPQPKTGRRHVCSWQHFHLVTEYRAAREQCEQHRDETVGIYGRGSQEWHDYHQQFAMITFRIWLLNTRGAHRYDYEDGQAQAR